MKQRKVRTTTTIPEDLYRKFRAIAVVKYDKTPYQRALCEALEKYVAENAALLKQVSK